MTTFPALIPSSRTFTPGEYPLTPFSGYSGVQGRVRHSDVFLSAQLRLSFLAISEAEMLSIWDHYTARRGGYEPFDLPDEITEGTSLADYVPTGYRWRYGDEGSVEDLPCGGHNVSLTLDSVAQVAVAALGADLALALSLAAGEAVIVSEAPGADLTLTLSLSAGAATLEGVAVAGADLTLSLSLDAGAAAGGAQANGADLTLSLSLAAGVASDGSSQSDYWSDWVAQNYGWESLIFIDWWGS